MMTSEAELKSQKGQIISWGWISFDGGDEGPARNHPRSIGYTVVVDEEDVQRCLKDLAASYLPPGTRFEIRRAMATNYGRTHGMAWFHTASFADRPEWGNEKPGFRQEGGYSLVGQFTTPFGGG